LRRTPNPWIAIPALALGLLAGFLGWLVTDVSCRQGSDVDKISGCPGLSLGVAVVSGVGATVGTALVLVLVYRSLAEWRQSQERARGANSHD
jgi:hypothetical protein